MIVPNEYTQQLDVEAEFYRKFDTDIKEYCADITHRIEYWVPERTVVLERVQSIASRIFSNRVPEIK